MNYLYEQCLGRALANTWIEITIYIWTITEMLSVFSFWTKTTVFLSWLISLIILLIWGYVRGFWEQLQKQILRNSEFWSKYNVYNRWLIVIGIYFVFVLAISILSSQYNVDSLVYHLPRIMHWIQNRSVGHFAAWFEAQVRYPCLSEYLVAQIYLLGCSDRLANLVQTFAYLGSSVMVFSISRKIGVSYKAAFTASVLYLLMPMAIAQAYSTQTDNIAGLFLLTYIFYILDFMRAQSLKIDKNGFRMAFFLSSNVMLGYLCKPTICFVMLVFFLGMCIIRLWRKDSLAVLMGYIVIGLTVAVMMGIPLYVKNYKTYISTEKIVEEQENLEENIAINSTVNDIEKEKNVSLVNTNQALTPDIFNVQDALKDPKLLIITCLQNVGRNSLSVCFPKYNEQWLTLIVKIGEWLGRDITAFKIPDDAAFFYQDMASNPCIMMLALLICFAIIFRISKPNKQQVIYVFCSVAGFLLQCGLMGYTHYRTRYLVGAMGVLCPAIAVGIDNLRVRDSYRNIIMALGMFGATIGGINTYSYELPRVKESFEGENIHQYFLGSEENEYVYAEMIRCINENGFKNIGLDGTLYLEYPLWQSVEELERVESVNITEQHMRQYEDMTYNPDCIVKVVSDKDEVSEGNLLECHGVTYRCIWLIHWYEEYYCLYA
jgi:hypothetical protein